MPSQGVFSNEGASPGQIKVLYQTINGKQHIKALNISNVDSDGDDIALSLAELDSISLPLSSSGELTELNVISITEKVGYFFVDVSDVIINDIQATQSNKIVGVSPYLAESFFYNNYNAIISNAENAKTSFLRYDVDRVGGQVKPTNYDAVTGFGKLIFSNPDSILLEDLQPITASSFTFLKDAVNDGGTDNQIIKSEVQSFFNDRDLDIMVLEPNLVDTLGVPQIPVLKPQATDSNYELIATSSFILEVDDNINFNDANNFYYSASIAEQIYVNGTINYTYTPLRHAIASGSATGGNVFVRLVEEHFVQSTSDTTQEIYYQSFLHSNPSTNNYFCLELYYNDQIPYAPLAPVQDSNYTTTGLINARYNGTKTGEDDFSGISPAVAAKPIEAALYRPDEDNNFICSQSLSDRTIEEVLFEGPTEFPEASVQTIGFLFQNNQIPSDTVITIQGIKNLPPQPGDILTVTDNFQQNGSAGTGDSENMLVSNVTPFISGSGKVPHYALTVTRNFDNALGGSVGTGVNLVGDVGGAVTRSSGARLLTIDKSRLIAVSDKKVWVKDNRNIIKTNNRGFITEISKVCTV